MREKGQVVIILLLVMVIALAVGLSVVGRSVSEVSNASKSEDASRAFSAAEAGIEKALRVPTPLPGVPLNVAVDFSSANRSQSEVEIYYLPALGNPGDALGYPPFGKESFAQFWLADPDNSDANGFPNEHYLQDSFNVYFGTAQSYVGIEDDQPGIEVSVVLANKTPPGDYKIKHFTFDSHGSPGRTGMNGCAEKNAGGVAPPRGLPDSLFYCRVTVNFADSGYYPVLARMRILFSGLIHPAALEPVGGGCGVGDYAPCSLPPQSNSYTSVGTAGKARRTIEVQKYKKVMPDIFSFALFSAQKLGK